MITITELIAVLFRVISLISGNPEIPEQVKTQVVNDIIVAVEQEQATTTNSTPSTGSSNPTPVIVEPTPITEPVQPIVIIIQQPVQEPVQEVVETSQPVEENVIITPMEYRLAKFGNVITVDGIKAIPFVIGDADKADIHVWSENVHEDTQRPIFDTKTYITKGFEKNYPEGFNLELSGGQGLKDTVITTYHWEVKTYVLNNNVEELVGTETGTVNIE